MTLDELMERKIATVDRHCLEGDTGVRAGIAAIEAAAVNYTRVALTGEDGGESPTPVQAKFRALNALLVAARQFAARELFAISDIEAKASERACQMLDVVRRS